MHDPRLAQVGDPISTEAAQVAEPLVDHLRLGLEREVFHRELTEVPGVVAIRPTADLEDQRLTALARKAAEVVAEILQEFEVDVGLDGRTAAPVSVPQTRRPKRLAAVAIHRQYRVERRG